MIEYSVLFLLSEQIKKIIDLVSSTKNRIISKRMMTFFLIDFFLKSFLHFLIKEFSFSYFFKDFLFSPIKLLLFNIVLKIIIIELV